MIFFFFLVQFGYVNLSSVDQIFSCHLYSATESVQRFFFLCKCCDCTFWFWTFHVSYNTFSSPAENFEVSIQEWSHILKHCYNYFIIPTSPSFWVRCVLSFSLLIVISPIFILRAILLYSLYVLSISRFWVQIRGESGIRYTAPWDYFPEFPILCHHPDTFQLSGATWSSFWSSG